MSDMNDFVGTYSGRHFHFLDPQVEDVCIDDIAYQLSRTNRWGGACRPSMNVADHSVRVSQMLLRGGHSLLVQMQGLLHDAAEAYLGDVPSPIKAHLPNYHALELLAESVIFEALGVKYPLDPMVKVADVEAYRWEYRDLMAGTDVAEPFGNRPTLEPMSPAAAHLAFLCRYWDLREALDLEVAA